MKFTIEIDLGNDAMHTLGDIARALSRIAATLAEEPEAEADPGQRGRIRDVNGNRVGEWLVVP